MPSLPWKALFFCSVISCWSENTSSTKVLHMLVFWALVLFLLLIQNSRSILLVNILLDIDLSFDPLKFLFLLLLHSVIIAGPGNSNITGALYFFFFFINRLLPSCLKVHFYLYYQVIFTSIFIVLVMVNNKVRTL